MADIVSNNTSIYMPIRAPHPSPLQLTRNQTPPIQRNRRPTNPRTSPTTQPNTRARDILRPPNPPQRHPALNTLPMFLQRRLHHLALKRPARNRVAGDAALAQVRSEHAAHVMQARFAGAVGEGFEGGDAQAVDAADVDDAGWGGGGGGGGEQGGEELRELEDAFEVQG